MAATTILWKTGGALAALAVLATPALAVQIDSMDNVAATGWGSAPPGVTSSGPGEPFLEGTASMKLPGSGAADNLQAFRVLAAPLDLSPSTDNFIQFWLHGDSSGNRVDLFLFDGENDLARSVHTITWTGWRPIVVRAQNIGPDVVANFNYADIRRIDFFAVGLGARGDLFVDDLRVEANPTIDAVVSSYDNDPWNESIGSAGGTAVFDSADKTDGRYSLEMAFTNVAFAQQYYNVLLNYEDFASRGRARDLSKWDRVTLDILGDGSGGELDLRFYTGSNPFYTYIPINFTGWQTFTIPRSAFGTNPGADWANIDSIRIWNRTTTAMTVNIDNVRMTNALPPDNSVDVPASRSTITVDGNPADWVGLDSGTMTLDTAGRGDLVVGVRHAWDDDNLYMLVQEAAGDTTTNEAASQGAYGPEPYNYDGVAFWMDLDNSKDGEQNARDFNPWLGLSSAAATDLFSYRANNDGTFIGSTPPGITIATSGARASNNRVIEARIPWSTLALVVNLDRQPGNDLLAAIAEGFSFGSDPLILDDNFNGQSFIGGSQFTAPSGTDENSRNIVLTGTSASVADWILLD